MAFIDDVSRVLNDVTNTAAEKTRNFSETARLNSIINEEEKKLNETYGRIGRMYCLNHTEDYEECYEAFINAVRDCERRIADAKKQILALKGIAICEKCGDEVSMSAGFCSNCGTAVPKPDQPAHNPDVSVCSRCGNDVLNTMNFCTQCGNPMNHQPTVQKDFSVNPIQQRTENNGMVRDFFTNPISQHLPEPEELENVNPGGDNIPYPESDEPTVSYGSRPKGLHDEQPEVQSLEASVAGFAAQIGTNAEITSTDNAEDGIIAAASMAIGGDDSLPLFNDNYTVPVGQPGLVDTYSPTQPMTAQRDKVCSVCGTVLSFDSVFCTECGSRL